MERVCHHPLRPQRLSLPTVTAMLPSFAAQQAKLIAAERRDGWLVACVEAGRYLAVCEELVAALVAVLESSPGPYLEVAAGSGELAAAIRAQGLDLRATDADPPAGAPVERLTAVEALRRYRPRTVLGAFVPCDAGIHEAVLGDPQVHRYLVLDAQLGDGFDHTALGRQRRWGLQRLPAVERWMLTRHDVDLGRARGLLRHGRAWLLELKETS